MFSISSENRFHGCLVDTKLVLGVDGIVRVQDLNKLSSNAAGSTCKYCSLFNGSLQRISLNEVNNKNFTF